MCVPASGTKVLLEWYESTFVPVAGQLVVRALQMSGAPQASFAAASAAAAGAAAGGAAALFEARR